MSLARSTVEDGSRVPIYVCLRCRETFAHRFSIAVNLPVYSAKLQRLRACLQVRYPTMGAGVTDP